MVASVVDARNFTPASFRATVFRALERNDALDGTLDPQYSDGPLIYGLIEDVEASSPDGHGEYLLLKVWWMVPCPDHQDVYLFRLVDRERRLILAAEANMATEGGTDHAEIVVTGFEQAEGPFIVRRTVAPRCAGRWHPERIEVLAASPDALRPRIVYLRSFPSWQSEGGPEEPRIITGPNGFRVIHVDVETRGDDRIICTITTNFQYADGGVVQVGPERSRPRHCELF